jgi:hypothetical protein
MPALGERRCFSLLARDIYPEFQLFRHPQFHMVLFPATESLSQISVFADWSPEAHARRVARACSILGASFRTKSSDLSIWDAIRAIFSSPDLSKNDAVKYSQRYTNLSSTSQVHTSPYWDCICIRAGGQTPAGEPPIREALSHSNRDQVAKSCWVYVSFCRNGVQLQNDWFSWNLVQLCC